LRDHPGVAEACVVGIEDEEWGQRVAAVVVANNPQHRISKQELMAFCRRRLAGYKQPRLIRFVEALPRTASGKVRRDKVKALMGGRVG
jgi:O-succinylbenzoic acid--CoA ligase